MTTTPDTRRRTTLLIAAGIVLLAALALAGGALFNRSSGSPHDAALRDTANRMLPALSHPGTPLPIQDQSLRSFQAWVYDTRAGFQKARKALAAGQYAQVQLFDPSVMPPQAISIRQAGHAVVALDSNLLGNVVRSHGRQFTDLQIGKQSYRVYVVAIPVPVALQSDNASGVLEILTPA